MNDRSYDGQSLSRRGRDSIESAARRWEKSLPVAAARSAYHTATTHEEIDAAFALAMDEKNRLCPEWLEYDQDYQDYLDACASIANDIWTESDAAHERLDPHYYD